MKILHIITRLDRGGPPRLLFNLSEYLKKEGHEVTILTGQSDAPEEDMEEFENRTGIPITVVRQLVREIAPVKDIIALFFLIKRIRMEAPDIVHTHTSKAGFLGRLAARICGVRGIVHTPHGHILYGYFGRAKTSLFVVLERFASYLSDRIITLTSLEKEDYIKLNIAKEEALIPIYCGIDLSRFDTPSEGSNIRNELDINEKQKLIGWVGRLEEVKGCFDFIRACNILKTDFPDARFLMAGDGSLKRDIKERIRRCSMQEIFFMLGHRDDVARIMLGIDIFVLTSVNEGLGLVIVEAMAAGRPVVATNVGGVSEIVLDGKTGILVEPCKPEALAGAIEKLLTDAEMAEEMGRKGRARAALFSVEETNRKTLQVYTELSAVS